MADPDVRDLIGQLAHIVYPPDPLTFEAELSDDGKSWTFNARLDYQIHDGPPGTCKRCP